MASSEQVISVVRSLHFESVKSAVTSFVKDAGAVIISAFFEKTTVSVSALTRSAISVA